MTFKKHNAIFLTVFALVSFFSCKHERQSEDIVLLYTTDVHGVVVPYNFHNNQPRDVSLANASTMIKNLRKIHGKNLLIVDGGDLYQGTPAMYYYNYYSTGQDHLISRVMNYLSYSALIVGNHDLEIGGARVDSLDAETRMPRLLANIQDSRNNRSRFRPYKIFERGGFRIAVIGFLTPETSDQIPRSLVPYMEYRTMLASASRWVKEIKANEEADYIVAVLHSGLKDVEFVTAENDTIRDGIMMVANEVPGIDLLLFGHDHGVYNGSVVNQYGDTVHILQSAAHGAEIGRVDIHLERDENSVLTKTTACERVDLKNFLVDEDYVREFSGVIDTVNEFLNRPISYLPNDLDMAGTLYKQTNTIDLIHAIQLDATDADISFCCALSTFADIPAGGISYRTVFNLYKYDNMLHKMWMNGAEIKKFLEYGYDRQFGRWRSDDSHLLAFQYDKNGRIIYARFGPELVTPQYNFTSAAGINYEVDVRKKFGERVRIISMADGTPFDETRQYTVAISSYQAAGGGGFIPRGLGWTKDDIAYHTLSVSSKTIAKLIVEFMKEEKHLQPINVGTWTVLPKEWAERMGPKDAALLIPYLKK